MISPQYTTMDFNTGTTFAVSPTTSNVAGPGDTVTVCGIIVANNTGTAATVDFIDNAGNIVLRFTVPPTDTENLLCHFVAKNGFRGSVAASSNVIATVFHTTGGV